MLKKEIQNYAKQSKNIVRHASSGRWYAPKGTKHWRPSVTTIINQTLSKGQGFDQWLGNHPSYKIACQERDIAANRGTLVHEYAEELLKGNKVVPESEEIAKYLMSFEKFFNENEIEVLTTELFMWDMLVSWAGTCDIICNLNGKLAIIDLKTGNYYKSHEIQLNMYRQLLLKSVLETQEEIDIYGLYVKGTWIKEPSYSLRKFKDNLDLATSTYDLWCFLNGGRSGKPWPKDKTNIKTQFELERSGFDDSIY